MYVLAIILARAGSKGLPDKCVRLLAGRPVIDYTFDHALAARTVDQVCFTTDSVPAADRARLRDITVIERPAHLATDTATVDAAARHAVECVEGDAAVTGVDVVVLLYGNIPIRPPGVIDRAVNHLVQHPGATSVRTVAAVSKHHPDWLHRLDVDRMTQFRKNSIYRRQDLQPLYYHDGAVAAVTRDALFCPAAIDGDGQAFLGDDRRAIVLDPEDVVDIDSPVDLFLAEAILASRSAAHPEAGESS